MILEVLFIVHFGVVSFTISKCHFFLRFRNNNLLIRFKNFSLNAGMSKWALKPPTYLSASILLQHLRSFSFLTFDWIEYYLISSKLS